MPDIKRRLLVISQQSLVLGTVAAVALPAASMVSLEIVGSAPPAAERQTTSVVGASLVAGEPVRPDVTEVPVEGVETDGLDALTEDPERQRAAADRLAALSAPEPVDGYATVGVTWDPKEHLADDEITVAVRTLEDGSWSAWEDVTYHDDHAPDPASEEARHARPGTEPIVVGDVDEVQVRAVTATGEAPADMELAVVDPGTPRRTALEEPAIDGAAAAGQASQTAAAAGSSGGTDAVALSAATTVPRPKIFSRAQWGANESLRSGSVSYGSVEAGFVHHTVNTNNYTREQVPALLRGIYAYHTQSRGWSDVGYNFLVDRFGRIWEGRHGGVTRAVVGAHTYGYNGSAFAMSAIGNFDTVPPPSKMVDAYGRLFAWKLALHGVKATATNQRVGSKTMPAINGHRDVGSTACPGGYLYNKIGRIRTLAKEYQAGTATPPAEPEPQPEPPVPTDPPLRTPAEAERSANITGSSWPDVVVRDRATRELLVVRTGGQVGFAPAESTGRDWRTKNLVAAVPDLTGDDVPDMVARQRGSGVVRIFPGTTDARLRAPGAPITRLSSADQLAGVGDATGDRRNDLVARVQGNRKLFLHPGNGRGGFGAKRLLATGWRYDLTIGVGDFDGDGRQDIAARNGEGRLQLFPVSRGKLGAPRTLPRNWAAFDLIAGAGDVSNDGLPDIVARDAESKSLYVYPGNGTGGFGHRIGPFTQLPGATFLAAPGQLAGNGSTDLVVRDYTGRIAVLSNLGRKNIAAVKGAGSAADKADLLLNVGDWDGDGHGDLMTRNGDNGILSLRKGDGKGHFGDHVRVAADWGSVRNVVAVGDVTGDGHPDVMGERDGAVQVFPGDGKTGFLAVRKAGNAARLAVTAGDRYDTVLSVGDANGDKRSDLLARERTSGKLWLLPGTGSGYGERWFVSDAFGDYDLVG